MVPLIKEDVILNQDLSTPKLGNNLENSVKLVSIYKLTNKFTIKNKIQKQSTLKIQSGNKLPMLFS